MFEHLREFSRGLVDKVRARAQLGPLSMPPPRLRPACDTSKPPFCSLLHMSSLHPFDPNITRGGACRDAQEVQNAYHTNALLVKLLLNQAQAHGCSLTVEAAKLENELLLKEMKEMERLALAKSAADFNRELSVKAVAVQDPRLLQERDSLRGEIASMEAKLRSLQDASSSALKGQVGLAEQAAQLQEQLSTRDAQLAEAARSQAELQRRVDDLTARAASAAASTSAVGERQVAELTAQVAQLRGDLKSTQQRLSEAQQGIGLKDLAARQAEEALEAKVQGTKQFQTLKAMMMKKSTEVVALRKRLAKYEPQAVQDADDGDDGAPA